ncbi:MAG: DALR domain-containing protein [Thermoleophilaceae bacterium]
MDRALAPLDSAALPSTDAPHPHPRLALWRSQAAGAARAGERGDLRLRTHRVRAGARGQRAPLRGLCPAQALPRARGRGGHAGRERHRRERQDLRRRPRRGRGQHAARRPDDRALRGRHLAPRAGPSRPRAAGGGHHRADRRPDRRPDRRRPRLRGRRGRLLPGGLLPGYGKLSNRPALEMRQGEGDDAAELKQSPHDFALWKAHKEGEDTSWPAPWGPGRPGWHIECSAMAEELLGTDFEIHGGGSDLVFPHHENEIAQTEAARGEPLARIWMHNGMVQMGEEKMAKSVGNIHLLHAALDEFGRDALVAYFTSGHYRQPIGYSADALAEAARSVDRLRELGRRLDPGAAAPEALEPYAERFFDHLADDFNTPAARSALFEWVAEANRRLDAGERMGPGRLDEMLHVLGLENLLEPEPGETPDAGAERLLAAARARPRGP